MKIDIISNDKTLIATLTGEIDHHSTVHIRSTIDEAIDRAKPNILIIDFTGVSFCDSSGIAVVIGRYKKMTSIGGSVQIINLNNSIKKIFLLSGINRFVQMN